MLAVFVEHVDGGLDPHGGYWRDASNVNVAMTDAQNKAFLLAAKAYKMGIIRRSQALADLVLGAADQTALDAIDTSAGWPA